jgi:hypothetical protein
MKGETMPKLLIMRKEIDLDASPVLYDRPFSATSLAADWQVRGAKWWVEGEWLTGRNPANSPGMVTSRASYLGNVLLDFEARTVLPSTHDIDCMWNGSWDETKNERGVAYVVGLQGWWEGKVGFEKSPAYTFCAATPLFPFEPGRAYRIQTGSVDGHVFVFVDGRLVLEVTDPDPIDSTRYGLIGFEAYASMIQVRRLVVRRIAWRPRELSYAPEF